MIRHLYLFCFLVLLVFSCRSSKKAVEDNPAVIECKHRAIRHYEEAENYFYKKEYHLARYYFSEALTYDCMEEIKIKGYFQKKRIPFKDLINQRVAHIDTIEHREWREKKKTCARILQQGDTLFARGKYEESVGLYRHYLRDCYPGKEKVEINFKILEADSLAKVKDSLEKEKKCSYILQEAEKLYEQMNYQRAREFYNSYEYWACPVKDSVSFQSKISELDSLINLEKN